MVHRLRRGVSGLGPLVGVVAVAVAAGCGGSSGKQSKRALAATGTTTGAATSATSSTSPTGGAGSAPATSSTTAAPGVVSPGTIPAGGTAGSTPPGGAGPLPAPGPTSGTTGTGTTGTGTTGTGTTGTGTTGTGTTGTGTTGTGTTGTGTTGTGTGSTGASPAPGSAPLVVVAEPNVATTTGIHGEAAVLRLALAAGGSAPVEVHALTVTAYGSIIEPRYLGALRLVGDDDRDGRIGPGEPTLGQLAAPAFTRNDGPATLSLSPPLVLAPGQTRHVLVAAEVLGSATGALTALPGRTVALRLAAAADVDARVQGGGALAAQGAFPLQGSLDIVIATHLLISEVVVGAGEFIELYNPTGADIDLSNVYLSDYADGAEGWWRLPSGNGFRPGTFSGDFLVRFPAGATVQAGQVVIVALNGDDYETQFSLRPDYSLTGNPWNANERMLFPDTSNPPQWRDRAPLFFTGSLRDAGEVVCAFTWDGQSDLVRDLDLVFYGSSSGSNAPVDRQQHAQDGPDADSTPTPYLPDTPAAQQAAAPTRSAWSGPVSIRRVDFSEAGERATHGNGVGGHDESSEPWHLTFQLDQPSPGQP